MKNKAKDIGYDVKPPEKVCDDPRCPFHGTLPIRGKILEGLVKSDKMQRTVVVERNTMKFIRKYERYERRHKRIAVHKPDCITVNKGDKVKFAECRPISKTKNFVIIEKM
ncbi:MAG: 30S ribosomal protein S17 [Candidatus Aenigmarchaeota archaeon]|nr:30S ribosomal protein S17 [Candidatus Aenigmarchaeota archaeon]